MIRFCVPGLSVRIILALFRSFHFQKSCHVFQPHGASMDPLLMLSILRVTKTTTFYQRGWNKYNTNTLNKCYLILTLKTTCIKLQSSICTWHLCWAPCSSALRLCPARYWVKWGNGQSFRYCVMKDLWGLSGMSSRATSTVRKTNKESEILTLQWERLQSAFSSGSTVVTGIPQHDTLSLEELEETEWETDIKQSNPLVFLHWPPCCFLLFSSSAWRLFILARLKEAIPLLL